MKFWQGWLRQPQRTRLRRASFQIHLWIGLAIGLYIVMLSITGSALVYRTELDRYFANEELGDSVTQGQYVVLWLTRLHDELLFEREGRFWNGVLSAIATLLFVTGIVVWWPGVRRWKQSLAVRRGVGWKRFNWDLHSALGFWLFLFMLMWGVSGFYLGVPGPFSNFVDWISGPDALGERPGDIVLMWLTRLHFGRWRGMPWLKALWAIVGLVPALMFFTGVVMWWNRVLLTRRASSR